MLIIKSNALHMDVNGIMVNVIETAMEWKQKTHVIAWDVFGERLTKNFLVNLKKDHQVNVKERKMWKIVRILDVFGLNINVRIRSEILIS